MKEWLTIRHLAGAVLLGLFFYIAGTGLQVGFEHTGTNLWVAIRAFACLIASACCFSRVLCDILSRPFHAMIDAVYFGSDDRDPPPVNLKLAGIYRLERRFDEAIAEYERQLEYHPRSPELWGEMIRTAREAGNRDLAESLQHRARRKLKRDDRLLLEREFPRLG